MARAESPATRLLPNEAKFRSVLAAVLGPAGMSKHDLASILTHPDAPVRPETLGGWCSGNFAGLAQTHIDALAQTTKALLLLRRHLGETVAVKLLFQHRFDGEEPLAVRIQRRDPRVGCDLQRYKTLWPNPATRPALT